MMPIYTPLDESSLREHLKIMHPERLEKAGRALDLILESRRVGKMARAQ